MASLTDHNSPYTQPVCQNCQTSTTPLWRRDEAGSVLCNACGLFLKLHGRPRPISLKTDVIKSRNRVKSSTQGPKKKVLTLGPSKTIESDMMQYESLPASQSVETTNGVSTHRRVSQMATSVASDRSGSPVSRTISPSTQQDPNIAPQHIFDGVALTDHTFQSPSLPALHLGQPSPGSASSDRHLEPPMTYEQLLAANTHLKTRVSELEVINMMYSDNENNLRVERDNAIRTQEDLKKRVQQLEEQLRNTNDQEHPSKKQRLSDASD